MTLTEYINEHYEGVQASFARAQNVKPPQVSQWIDKDFIVLDHKLYSPRRELAVVFSAIVNKEEGNVL